MDPSKLPSKDPSKLPSIDPSKLPSMDPSKLPSIQPSKLPSKDPSKLPSMIPSKVPSLNPSKLPSKDPSKLPSTDPSKLPSMDPSKLPSIQPSKLPSMANGIFSFNGPQHLETFDGNVLATLISPPTDFTLSFTLESFGEDPIDEFGEIFRLQESGTTCCGYKNFLIAIWFKKDKVSKLYFALDDKDRDP